MGREVRMVPEGWEHPKSEWSDMDKPLKDGYKEDFAQFQEDIEERGLAEALDLWDGGPVSHEYMLADCDDSERTWYMMYEDTSKGTPISPAFETPEELARWLAGNGATMFGSDAATYEQWLPICKSSCVPGVDVTPGVVAVSEIQSRTYSSRIGSVAARSTPGK